jgi:hypothetical protein
MHKTRFASSRVTAAIVWPTMAICVLSVVLMAACAKPRSDGYRRVEIFSAGSSKIQFRCLINVYSCDTFVATTPWKIEMDLDTIDDWYAGRVRVSRANPGPDKLWVWGYDRDSLRIAKCLATQFDTVDIDLWNWYSYRDKP